MTTRIARTQDASTTGEGTASGGDGTATGDGSAPADRLAAVINALPDDLDHAGEAMGNALRSVGATVSDARDDSLLAGASLSAGVAIGLLLGGAPRLFTAAAVAVALSLGTTLAQRRSTPRRAAA